MIGCEFYAQQQCAFICVWVKAEKIRIRAGLVKYVPFFLARNWGRKKMIGGRRVKGDKGKKNIFYKIIVIKYVGVQVCHEKYL